MPKRQDPFTRVITGVVRLLSELPEGDRQKALTAAQIALTIGQGPPPRAARKRREAAPETSPQLPLDGRRTHAAQVE